MGNNQITTPGSYVVCTAYREHQDKKKRYRFIFKIPKSMIAKKQLKVSIFINFSFARGLLKWLESLIFEQTLYNFHVYNSFTDEQKSRLLKLLPNCDLVPIASDDGDPIDTPRIEREYLAAGLDSYKPSISPNKVCPRVDF